MLLSDLIDSLNEPMGLQNRPADTRAFSLPQFKKRPWDRGCADTTPDVSNIMMTKWPSLFDLLMKRENHANVYSKEM